MPRVGTVPGLVAVAILAVVALAASALPVAPATGPVEERVKPIERFLPRAPGTERDLLFRYGPFTIPPGQDMNRLHLDVPLTTGFIVDASAAAIDAQTGHIPREQEFHVHHGVWFDTDPDALGSYDYVPGATFYFATGEERTRASYDARSFAEPGGPRYGVFVDGKSPDEVVYMLHNKQTTSRTVWLDVRVRFVDGTAEAIAAATSCPNLAPLAGEACAAGAEFRNLANRLWGSIFDVPREPVGDGVYAHPLDLPVGHPKRLATDHLGRFTTSSWDGTLIGMAAHLHVSGMEVVIVNVGPKGSACEKDLDGDGFPGVTLLRAKKVDRNPLAWPHSEEYQMEASKPGFRAPIRKGDRIAQIGIYSNAVASAEDAMSFASLHVDTKAPPPPLVGPCTLGAVAPYLVDDPAGDPTRGVLTRAWDTPPNPLCGPGLGPACDAPATARPDGLAASEVHIASFAYVPGDLGLGGPLGAPPKVKQGQSLRFVNEDGAALVRHTVTSCEAPCNGAYVANYPLPDGRFDSGKILNLDYADEGLVTSEASPAWSTPKDLEPGVYTYYCRIHPWMRGAFEVVA